MAWTFFKAYKKGTLDGATTNAGHPVEWDADTIGLLLLDSGYTADQSDVNLTDLTLASNEVSGSNYVRKEVTSKVVAYTGSNARVTTTMTDPSYAQHGSGFNNAKHAILYKTSQPIGSETQASSPLIAYNTFTSNQGNVSGTLTLEFQSDIILTLS